jgi:hypothetical protein
MGTLLRLAPRIAILLTSAVIIASGDYVYGAFCVVALGITLIPAAHTRSFDAGIPVALELVLLWLMIADMTLGNALGLYQVVWFDKVVHLSSSTLIATIGFLAIYVVHLTQRTRFHPWVDGIVILLVTLGLGALWEIGEYGVDQLLGRKTQGSPDMAPLDDTMFDLVLDGVGALLVAIIGPIYLRHSKQSRRGLVQFARLLERRYG